MCLENRPDHLSRDVIDERIHNPLSTPFPLTVGRTYTVHAITLFRGVPWYYVFDDDQRPYPLLYPAPSFHVVDGRVPVGWRYTTYTTPIPSKFFLPFTTWPKVSKLT